MQLSAIAKVLSVPFYGNDHDVKGFSIDTRTINRGEVFFALQGKNSDGHEHIQHAIKQGASAAIVSRSIEANIPLLKVENVHQALIKLSQFYRHNNHARIAAITGSCGKTTTRALLASILSQQAKTLASEKSYNNDIGVPLTLLKLTHEHQYAVFELGANHAGEIANLTHLVLPHVAVITNAGPAHLEGFGSLEGVACAKGEIYQGLSENGIAILNKNDHYYDFWYKLTGNRPKVTFGVGDSADIRTQDLVEHQGHYQFELRTPEGTVPIMLKLLGRHNVMNALAAAAAAYALNINIDLIKTGLENCTSEEKRLIIKKGFNHSNIIDDSFNANPLSVAAAIDVLSAQHGEKILVLGDMLELGAEADEWHRTLGVKAAEKGIDRLFCLGKHSQFAAQAFGGEYFTDRDHLISELKKVLHPQSTVLIKGSKPMQMGLVVEALIEKK